MKRALPLVLLSVVLSVVASVVVATVRRVSDPCVSAADKGALEEVAS